MLEPVRVAAGFFDRHRLLTFAGLLLVGYGVALVHQGGLDFPIYKDESQFWTQTQFFAEHWPPSLEQIRGYPEPMTPLSFLTWATLERAFGGGLPLGRGFDLLVSIAVMALVVFHGRRGRGDPLLAAAGLMAFPYFLPMSIHLYTDMLAAFFVLAGVRLHASSRPIWAAFFFALGVATRQYMVAFPLAIAAHELGGTLARRGEGFLRVLPPALAAATLLFWLVLFGGLGPSAGLEKWPRHTDAMMGIIPEHGLYFLICLGGYFALPELVMFSLLPGRFGKLSSLFTAKNALLAALLFAAFVTWPPTFGALGTRGAMGMFNRAGHFFVPNQEVRLVVYFLLAWLACIRFGRIDLGFWLVFTNAAIMMYSTGWDKYMLPVLAVFWFLGPANGSIGPPLLWRDDPPGSVPGSPPSAPLPSTA